MRHVDARVDDGDDLSFTLLGDLVDVHHEMGAQVGGVLPTGLRGLDAPLGIGRGHITDATLALAGRAIRELDDDADDARRVRFSAGRGGC